MDKTMIPELIENIKNQMDEMDDVVHALQKELGIPDTVLAGIWAQLIWETVQSMTNPYRATLEPEKVKDYKTAINDALRIIETEFPLSVDLGPTVPTMGIRRVHRLIEELGEGGTVMSSPAAEPNNKDDELIRKGDALLCLTGEFPADGRCDVTELVGKFSRRIRGLKPVVAENATGDTISRQAAIDALDCINGVEEVLRSLPPAEQSKPKILYRHFKRGVYEYLYTATDTETGDDMVVYKSVDNGAIWVRPAAMFYGAVEPGKCRFTLIKDESGPA